MKLKEILQEIENRDSTEELQRKRFACAQCGATWIELVGLVVGHKNGKEDLCLRIGMDPKHVRCADYAPESAKAAVQRMYTK